MRRGQFWYGDFLVAVLILMIIGMLFVTSIRDITSRNEVLKELILEASDISSGLMTEGYGTQENWNNGIGTIGLITGYKLDYNKLINFLELRDYNQQRVMLGTLNNVWIYLQRRDGTIADSNKDKINDALGYTINSVSDINAKNLVHIKRFVFYDEDEDGKGDIYTLGVVVWQ